MLEMDENAKPNYFFDTLSAESWSADPKVKTTLFEKPDLTQIVTGGAKTFFSKSFFYYMGSESTPPCMEGVLRVIFE